MSIKLFHFPNARSLRVVWAIEELGVDAEIETKPLDFGFLKSPEYLALHPMGKIPVMFDGDKRIIESTAMIEYIAKKYSGGQLTRDINDSDYAEYLQWLHFGEGGMGGYVNMLIGHTALLPEDQRDAGMAKWATGEVSKCLAFIEEGLGGKDYLLDDFSLADISVIYMLFLIKITGNGGLLPDMVNTYFKKATARDAWKRACER